MRNRTVLAGWRKRWNRSLLHFLSHRVRAAVDIEDLAQETYLRLLRVRDLSEVRNPQAYLLRVASHVVTEWRHHQLPTDSIGAEDEEILIDEKLPELDLDARLSQARLDQALAAMTPRMRAVVLLRLRDEQSIKEIAAALDLTVRQVRRYLARGYHSLGTALQY